MLLLVKSCRIIDKNSPHHGKIKDILLQDNSILSIENKIEATSEMHLYEHPNLHVSLGWIDLRSNGNEPGNEHKEDLHSLSNAAAFGGFTSVCVTASTHPAIHSKSEVEYIINKSKDYPVSIFPIGAVTKNCEGKEMAELYDMHQSGAIAFSDNKNTISNAGVMIRALMYAKGFNGLVMHFANDKNIAHGGLMNEGKASTSLGLKGMPALAEELCVARDLSLSEYNQSPIHFMGISTAASVALIRQAKASGISVTADVAAHQLFFDDEALNGFDTNLKVLPPLRTQKDILALVDGLKDGTIDCICSDHTPQEPEAKVKEFEHAEFGMLGLETCFASLNTNLKDELSLDSIIEKIAVSPRKILLLPANPIAAGQTAELSFFDPELKWVYSEKDIHSKSRNTPYVGKKFIGKALAIYNKGKFTKA